MRNTAIITPARTHRRERLSLKLLRRLLFRRLSGLQQGRLNVMEAGAVYRFGQETPACRLHASVRIHDPRVYRRLVLRGSIGAAEGYMAGEWSCDDLTTLARLFVRNRRVLDGLEQGPVQLAMMLFRAGHAQRRNNRYNSRRNIAVHYDLGNDFYRLFLDPSLMYSCALFERPDMSLAEAALAKLERICRKLALGPHDHVLEIGSGWGGFALHAARHYGCRVTTTTISRGQYALARERVAAAGLTGRIEVLYRDYRDLRGCYDKLVSIEMIEAVGHQYFTTFFQHCARLLKEDGLMLLQAITIAEQEYRRAKRTVDFIQKYIFPGGCLPSLAALSGAWAQGSDLRLIHLEDIGPHYALTLSHWRQRFRTNLDRVRAQGFDERFIRMWEYYFCYCEGGFLERAIGTAQLLLAKPLNRQPPVLGTLG